MSPRTKIQLEENRLATETRILKSALTIFSSQGFAGASIRKIARDAGISDGLMYNYFKSKEVLALAVLKSSFQTLDETIIYDETKSPEENFKQSVNNFIDLIQKEKTKIRLLAQMGLHEKKFNQLNQATTARYEESVSKFSEIFRAMKIENPVFEARILVASLDGIVFESLLMDQPFSLEKFRENLIKKYCT